MHLHKSHLDDAGRQFKICATHQQLAITSVNATMAQDRARRNVPGDIRTGKSKHFIKHAIIVVDQRGYGNDYGKTPVLATKKHNNFKLTNEISAADCFQNQSQELRALHER